MSKQPKRQKLGGLRSTKLTGEARAIGRNVIAKRATDKAVALCASHCRCKGCGDCGAMRMEWLSNLLITKEALALLIAVVSASVFAIAWRLWG
jgi:hypothetical protein